MDNACLWRVRLCSAVLASSALLSLPAFSGDVNLLVQDEQGAPVPDAAVYWLPQTGKAPRGAPVGSIAQQGKAFIPYVSVLQVGTAVSFPNRDTVRHHVYSFSPAKVFDLKLYSGTPAQPVVFDKPGLVVLGCNIHDWMLAYVLIVDTPWFDVSNESGAAQVKGLPSGDYRLVVWHPRMKEESMQQIKVGTAPVSQRIRIQLSKPDLRKQGG